SKRSVSIRSDCASTPTRGSRFVGLLSMTITSVVGSGLRAQPAKNKTTETQRHRENLDLGFGKYQLRSCRSSWLGLLIFSSCRSLCLCVSVVNKILRIADLAQDRRTFGSGRGWYVGRQMAPSLVRKHRESDRFLCLRREPKVVAGAHSHFQRRQFFSNHSHQGQIVRSPAGDDELAKTYRRLDQWQHKLAHGDADGTGGKRGCGGDN